MRKVLIISYVNVDYTSRKSLVNNRKCNVKNDCRRVQRYGKIYFMRTMNYNRESFKNQMICETVTPFRFQKLVSGRQILRGFSPDLPLFLHLTDAQLSPFQFARKMFFLAPWLEAANGDDLEIVRTSSRAWRNAWTRRDFFSLSNIHIYLVA